MATKPASKTTPASTKTATKTATTTNTVIPKTSNALAPVTSKGPTAKSTALITAADSALLADMEESSIGEGLEEADRDSVAIPFLTILQDLSPQVKSKKPEYIPGAKVGQFLQTVTKEVFDEVRVIPCYFSRIFIEWIPRAEGGGLVAVYDAATGLKKAQTAERDGGKLILPNKHELADTRQHFVLLIKPDGTTQQLLIALTSSGIKRSKNWLYMIRGAVEQRADGSLYTPKAYACSFRVTTEEVANDQGQWHTWVFDDRQKLDVKNPTDVQLYTQAKLFYTQLVGSSGKANVDYADLQSQASEAAGVPSERDLKRGTTYDGPVDLDDNELGDDIP